MNDVRQMLIRRRTGSASPEAEHDYVFTIEKGSNPGHSDNFYGDYWLDPSYPDGHDGYSVYTNGKNKLFYSSYYGGWVVEAVVTDMSWQAIISGNNAPLKENDSDFGVSLYKARTDMSGTTVYVVSDCSISSYNGQYYLYCGEPGTNSAVYTNGTHYLYMYNGIPYVWNATSGYGLFVGTSITGSYTNSSTSGPGLVVSEYVPRGTLTVTITRE